MSLSKLEPIQITILSDANYKRPDHGEHVVAAKHVSCKECGTQLEPSVPGPKLVKPTHSRKIDHRGRYRSRKVESVAITFEDLDNPHTFYALLHDESSLVKWLQQNRLIASQLICQTCHNLGHRGIKMNIKRKTGHKSLYGLGHVFRCCRKTNHEITIYKHSYFHNLKHPIQDCLVFVHSMLTNMNLKSAADFAGISYSNTAVLWARDMRDVIVQWVYNEIITAPMKFTGVIEIDESLFGRKVINILIYYSVQYVIFKHIISFYHVL